MDSRLRGNDGRGAGNGRVRCSGMCASQTPMDSRLRGNDGRGAGNGRVRCSGMCASQTPMDSRLRGNDGRGAGNGRVRCSGMRASQTPMDSRLRGNDIDNANAVIPAKAGIHVGDGCGTSRWISTASRFGMNSHFGAGDMSRRYEYIRDPET